MLLDYETFSQVSSILNKAVVPLLVLKLTAIKTHPMDCTMKHILSL